MLILEDIELSCYEIICMFALYSPIEIHKELLTKLFNIAYQFNPIQEHFTLPELAVWTSLLLFINPIRLKLQCIYIKLKIKK